MLNTHAQLVFADFYADLYAAVLGRFAFITHCSRHWGGQGAVMAGSCDQVCQRSVSSWSSLHALMAKLNARLSMAACPPNTSLYRHAECSQQGQSAPITTYNRPHNSPARTLHIPTPWSAAAGHALPSLWQDITWSTSYIY